MLWASWTPSSRGSCLGSLTCPMGTSSRFCSLACGALLVGAADPARPGSSAQAPADRESAVRLLGAGSTAAANACGGANAASEPAPLLKHQHLLRYSMHRLTQKPATRLLAVGMQQQLKAMPSHCGMRQIESILMHPCYCSALPSHALWMYQNEATSKPTPEKSSADRVTWTPGQERQHTRSPGG